MTDGVTIRTNLPDVSRKLRELGTTLSKRLVRASTAAAAQTLAKQVRSAAAYGLCDAAEATLERVHALDQSYADELRSGPVMAPCRH